MSCKIAFLLLSAQHSCSQTVTWRHFAGLKAVQVHVPSPVHPKGYSTPPLGAKLAAAWAPRAMKCSTMVSCLDGLRRLMSASRPRKAASMNPDGIPKESSSQKRGEAPWRTTTHESEEKFVMPMDDC